MNASQRAAALLRSDLFFFFLKFLRFLFLNSLRDSTCNEQFSNTPCGWGRLSTGRNLHHPACSCFVQVRWHQWLWTRSSASFPPFFPIMLRARASVKDWLMCLSEDDLHGVDVDIYVSRETTKEKMMWTTVCEWCMLLALFAPDCSVSLRRKRMWERCNAAERTCNAGGRKTLSITSDSLYEETLTDTDTRKLHRSIRSLLSSEMEKYKERGKNSNPYERRCLEQNTWSMLTHGIPPAGLGGGHGYETLYCNLYLYLVSSGMSRMVPRKRSIGRNRHYIWPCTSGPDFMWHTKTYCMRKENGGNGHVKSAKTHRVRVTNWLLN